MVATSFATLTDGLQNVSLFDQAFAQCLTCATPTIVNTPGTYTIPATRAGTPKSVLFVDDNPVERESVRLALPGIRVIGSNPYVIRRILLWSSETQIAVLSEESAKHEQMMRQQIKREDDRASISREEFLAKLNCSLHLRSITSLDSEYYARAFELINKPIQYNWQEMDDGRDGVVSFKWRIGKSD